MQEALGELFDQRNDMMPEHTLSQRTNTARSWFVS